MTDPLTMTNRPPFVKRCGGNRAENRAENRGLAKSSHPETLDSHYLNRYSKTQAFLYRWGAQCTVCEMMGNA